MAKAQLEAFTAERGLKIAAFYIENERGASLQRPALFKLMADASPGDILLIEQVDRLSGLNESDWLKLQQLLNEKHIKVVGPGLAELLDDDRHGRDRGTYVERDQKYDAGHARGYRSKRLRDSPPAGGTGRRNGKGNR